MIPDTHANIVSWDAKSIAHVATIGPSGEPHSSPVWFEWDGTWLRFAVDDRSQKTKNLRRESRVSVSVVDPRDPYRYLEFRGEVESIDTDHDLVFLTRMSKKYLDLDHYPWVKYWEKLVVIKILPTKVSGVR